MARKQQAELIHDRQVADPHRQAIVTIAIVDDPYSSAGEKIKVTRNVREDTLELLYLHSRIDSAQLTAGRMWQACYERSEISGLRGIELKIAVDGGLFPELVSDETLKSFNRLNSAARHLGHEGAMLIHDVLGKRMSIRDAGVVRGIMTRHELSYLSLRFRECLESLAIFWGLAQQKHRNLTSALT